MIKEELSVDESKSCQSLGISKSEEELNEFDIDDENNSNENCIVTSTVKTSNEIWLLKYSDILF